MVERMKYIAARETFDGHIYFQDNINDSPKWTGEFSEAKRFDSEEEALSKSDKTGLYAGSIITMEVSE